MPKEAKAGYRPTSEKDTGFFHWWTVTIVTVVVIGLMICLGGMVARAGEIIGAILLYGAFNNYLAPIRVRQVVVPVKGRSWIGVHITDLHLGPFSHLWLEWFLLRAIRKIEKRFEIDHFYLTGDDLGLRSSRATKRYAELLKRLREVAPHAVFHKVIGGHEVEFLPGELERILEDNGVKCGENEWAISRDIGVRLGADSDHLDPATPGSNPEAWQADGLAHIPPGVSTTVWLCHAPGDIDPEMEGAERINLYLSGHRHIQSVRRWINGVVHIISAGFGGNFAELFGWGILPWRLFWPGITIVVAQHHGGQ